MPFIPHTPESLLARSDSKDPATTCKGLTETGRHCRRSLAASPRPSPLSSRHRGGRDGVLAVLSADESHDGAAAFFCWQHKDQAASLQNDDRGGLAQGTGNVTNTNIIPLTERTSIDTLVDRLGVLDVQNDQESPSKSRRKRRQTARPVRKDTLPQKWQNVQGPLIPLPNGGGSTENPFHNNQKERQRQPGFWETLCCMVELNDRPKIPPAKPRPHPPSTSARPINHTSYPQHPTTPKRSSRPPLSAIPSASTPISHTTSHTQNLLSLIPRTLSPQTTSALLAELAKPVSTHDEEGWIYIFWLTPDSTASPDADAVSSLLTSNTPSRQRRASEVLKQASVDNRRKPLLLKIGRASNVQRRMNEWTRQCGYNLSLVRFYPYVPSSPLPSPMPSPGSRRQSSPGIVGGSSAVPHKVPHAHKVERLIHLELAERRVKKDCDACGKEHREWFEVEGTREGIKAIDEVVRRWIGWAENNANS